MSLHQCSICGFKDNQDDMVQDDFGGWVHKECEQDALNTEEEALNRDISSDEIHEDQRHQEEIESRLDDINIMGNLE